MRHAIKKFINDMWSREIIGIGIESVSISAKVT